MDVAENFTLLLVDDNPTNLLLLAQIIEMDLPGVRVLQARSAREGLKLVDEEVIDGAFIDVQMPQMSGLDMCRELRKRPHTANIPLVLLTAHMAAPEMRAEGLEVGAYDFITQPISNVEMLARVKVMLRMCAGDRRISQNQLQLKQELVDRSDHLRWISGLLISGEGALKPQDEIALQRLSQKVAEMKVVDDQLSFDQVALELPLPWRRTLLKLSMLESVPMPLAHELSEITDIRAVVTYLERHDILVLDQGSCSERLVFKSDIRSFLCARAQSDLSAEERKQVLERAANYYRSEKDYRGVVSCLIAAQKYEETAQIFSQIGFSMGMHRFNKELCSLIDDIPEDVLVTNGWLTLFKARSLLTAFSADTTAWLELAWQQFEANQDQRGQLLTMVLQAVQSIYVDGSYESWFGRVAFFRQLYNDNAEGLHPSERFKVMFAQCLIEIFINGDLARAEAISYDSLASAQQQKHVEAQLEFTIIRINIALWQGRQRVAAAFLEQGFKLARLLNDPLFDLALEMMGCEFLYSRGDHRGLERLCRDIMSRLGSAILHRTVIDSQLTYLQVLLMLPFPEQRVAYDLLDIALTNNQVLEYGHEQSRLLQLRGFLHSQNGLFQEARADLEIALQLRRKAGGCLYGQENRLLAAMTCFQLKEFEEAQNYLEEALVGEEPLEDRIRPGVHAWLAAVLLKRRKRIKALGQLELLMECLRKQRNCYFWGLTPDLPDYLLPLLDSKRDFDLFRPMFEKFQGKTLTMDGVVLPLLKVRCLGAFEVELHGRVFSMGDVGQASRQIFSLLVAAPGQSLSIEKIMVTLWPDSSPPKARNSFDTAHLRLRKALEAMFGDCVRKDYLVLEKGLLSLKHAQIDSAAFSQTYERVQYHLQRENFWQAENACRNMDQLWQGKFLNGYDLDDELAALGERLTQMRIDQLSSLAGLLMKKKSEEAKGLLQQCLTLDPTQDSIIRQLLLLYRGQRDYRSASALLEQYRKALLAEEYEQDEVDELLEALDGKWSSVAELQ